MPGTTATLWCTISRRCCSLVYVRYLMHLHMSTIVGSDLSLPRDRTAPCMALTGLYTSDTYYYYLVVCIGFTLSKGAWTRSCSINSLSRIFLVIRGVTASALMYRFWRSGATVVIVAHLTRLGMSGFRISNMYHQDFTEIVPPIPGSSVNFTAATRLASFQSGPRGCILWQRLRVVHTVAER